MSGTTFATLVNGTARNVGHVVGRFHSQLLVLAKLVALAALLFLLSLDPHAVVASLLQYNSLFVIATITLSSMLIALLLHATFIRIRFITGIPTISEQPSTMELLGHFLGVIGVVYAVVLAFVVVTTAQEYDHIAEVSLAELQATHGLFDVIGSYDSSQKDDYAVDLSVQSYIASYAAGMTQEWDEMRRGYESCGTLAACIPADDFAGNQEKLDNILSTVSNLSPTGLNSQAIYEDALRLAQDAREARDHRRHHYSSHIEDIMWWTLILGGIITLSTPYFGAHVPPNQLFRTLALSAMIGMMLTLTLVFDNPFTGQSSISVGSEWNRLAGNLCAKLDSVDASCVNYRANRPHQRDLRDWVPRPEMKNASPE